MLIEQDKLFIEDENTKKSDNSSIQVMVKGYLSFNICFLLVCKIIKQNFLPSKLQKFINKVTMKLNLYFLVHTIFYYFIKFKFNK